MLVCLLPLQDKSGARYTYSVPFLTAFILPNNTGQTVFTAACLLFICPLSVQKVVFEAPSGLKQNLRRTSAALTTRAGSSSMSPEQVQLQMLLAWLHAVIQVRSFSKARKVTAVASAG
jgi:hypothetical protein